MSVYEGTPTKSTSITLADDASPPQAGAINPGISACFDYSKWLEREIGRKAAALGAQNFMPCSWRAPWGQTAIVNGAPGTPVANLPVVSIGASSTKFVVAWKASPLSAIVAESADGQAWTPRGLSLSVNPPGRGPLGCIAARDDGYIVAGHMSDTGAGQNIDVLAPGGSVWNTTARASLSSATSYRSGVFAGSKCYLFGSANGERRNAEIGGQEPRIVCADVSSAFLTWTTPSGGAFVSTEDLWNADTWWCVSIGNIVVAMPRGTAPPPLGGGFASSEYIYIDSTVNVATRRPFPISYCAGLVVWRGKFWTLRYNPLTTQALYSSADGITWKLESSVTAVTLAYGLGVAGDSLVTMPGNAGGPAGPPTPFSTFDGLTWTAMPTQIAFDFNSDLALTEKRMMVRYQPYMAPGDPDTNQTYDTDATYLRVSLGSV